MSYRITRTDPYANREDEALAETIESAVAQVDEWTGVGEETIRGDLEIQALPIGWTDLETHVEVVLREER